MGADEAVSVGRSPKSDIMINLPGVSNRHAELRLLPSKAEAVLAICDLSSNGSALIPPDSQDQQLLLLAKGELTPLLGGAIIRLPAKVKTSEGGPPASDLRASLRVELEVLRDTSREELEGT